MLFLANGVTEGSAEDAYEQEYPHSLFLIQHITGRRRIKTEDKAKVVAAVMGERICSIPCRASCFAQDDFE